MAREIENNKVHLIGKIIGDFTLSHEKFGEKFYTVKLEVKRLSDKTDIIPMMISDRLINISENYVGRTAEVYGQFRSYNRHEGNRNHLTLYMFVLEISFMEEITYYIKTNQIFLDGYICKPPLYRKTFLGRKITNVFLAVNRNYGKSDYIPCIAWGRNAVYASNLNVGDQLRVEGRIQSRNYQKRISETEVETRMAIEVSVSKLVLVQ